MGAWDSIVGHVETLDRLGTLLREGRMPHAILLAGPEGIGKSLIAKSVAAALFCASPGGPCGVCVSCRALASGTHPDLHQIEPEGQSIKIDAVRRILADIALAPYLSARRVVIVDHAEAMNVQSANCLLKTLEEPVGETFFILTAANRRMLLDTILSRCMVFLLHPLSSGDIVRVLIGRGMSAEDAEAVARLSGGSLKKAAELAEGGGLALRDEALGDMGALADAPMEEVWRRTQALGELDREKLGEYFLQIELIVRDLFVLHGDESSILLYNADAAERLSALAPRWTDRELWRVAGQIEQARRMLRVNANARLVAEQFYLKLRDMA